MMILRVAVKATTAVRAKVTILLVLMAFADTKPWAWIGTKVTGRALKAQVSDMSKGYTSKNVQYDPGSVLVLAILLTSFDGREAIVFRLIQKTVTSVSEQGGLAVALALAIVCG